MMTGVLKTIVCDNGDACSRRFAELLSRMEGVELTARTSDGQACARDVAANDVDAVFLLVKPPDFDGFHIADVIDAESGKDISGVSIVFVADDADAAAKAFDFGATDFLQRTVDATRLEITIGRLRRAADRRSSEVKDGRGPSGATGAAHSDDTGYIWIRRRGGHVRIHINDVTVIRAEAEYVRLFVGTSSYLHRQSLGALDRRLDSGSFVRVHRSTIVRTSEVVGMRRSQHGGTVVRLANGDEFPVGRTYARRTRAALLDGDAASPRTTAAQGTPCEASFP